MRKDEEGGNKILKPVTVRIVSVGGFKPSVILENHISLEEEKIRDYSLQGSDIWCYEQNNVCCIRDAKEGSDNYWYLEELEDKSIALLDPPADEEESKPKVRVRIYYNYSDVQRYNSLLQEWID